MTGIEIFLIVYFSIALFIAIFMDSEQIIIKDPYSYDPNSVCWPPKAFIKMIHWWGENYDPCLMQRANYFRCFIWIDMIYYIPAYFVFIYLIASGHSHKIQYQICIQQTMLMAATLSFLFDNFIQFREKDASLKTYMFSLMGYGMYIIIPSFILVYNMIYTFT